MDSNDASPIASLAPPQLSEWPCAQRGLLGTFLAALLRGDWRASARQDTVYGRVLTFKRWADSGLTPREHDVLARASSGRSNKYIAIELRISCSTASTTFSGAIAKLGFETPLEFLSLASSLRCPQGGPSRYWLTTDRCLLLFQDRVEPDEVDQRLTTAERDVVARVLQGETNGAIARARCTSPHTVANQLAAVYRKLGAGSRRELVTRFGRPISRAA